MTKPCVAASSYLNAAPLIYSFIEGSQKERCSFVSDASPARCAEMLTEGIADAALIPVIEFQRLPGLEIASGACVASKERVRSVLLASKVPIHKVRSVALDTSSRTSAALIQILLGRFYNTPATYAPFHPDLPSMLAEHDAALMIGDPAMLIDRTGLHIYDLAEEWNKHTGLPFVFAFWVVRSDSSAWKQQPSQASERIDFRAAMREGVAHADKLADDYSVRLGLPRSDLFEYLTKNISYDLDAASIEGLKLYFDLAFEAGLIPGLRSLAFLDE